MPIPRVYWDTSCFISFLSNTHPDEKTRAEICDDVLRHARAGDLQIWTSVWTIVETIRPKEPYVAQSLPPWSVALDVADKSGALVYPKAKGHLEVIWNYYHRNTMATRKLSTADANKIKQMFAWPFIFKIQIVPTIAEHAADIARTYNMKPGDSLHVASAIARGCEYIHRWDRDYSKTDGLIQSKEPIRISPPNLLTGVPALPQSAPTSPALPTAPAVLPKTK
jgi:predicted nucleic acid-binding protein